MIALGALAGVVLTLLALRSRFTTVTVSGRSMEPTLQHGDRLLVLRTRLRATHRGRLVVLPAAGELGTEWMVKRVVAVPGDPVPLADVPALAAHPSPVVPDGQMVVLGDNQVLSLDSRRVGYVPARPLLGVVVRHLPTAPPRRSAGR
ncbi:signal peptidase I [Nonomuraea sp. NPDC050556]|uniref:signal peptidase I n=1 Tax=Nonomuraea sp. NPDC050556 TaxID=3364369 RepID=UPI00379AE80A